MNPEFEYPTVDAPWHKNGLRQKPPPSHPLTGKPVESTQYSYGSGSLFSEQMGPESMCFRAPGRSATHFPLATTPLGFTLFRKRTRAFPGVLARENLFHEWPLELP